MRRTHWLLCVFIAWNGCLASAVAAQDGPSYARLIQPILSDNCFTCHGPDAGSREADLRLDLRAAALAAGAFEPGSAATSELVKRIRHVDTGERMPPPESGHTLSDEQKQLLERWIDAGAHYEAHWSFVPLSGEVAVPQVQAQAWPRGPIDRFVLERLEREGIAPAAETPRWRWLRRASFDLLGLPPKPAELAAFEADRDHGAYARAVDRMLARPAFGEHQAVPWLDVARYADSYGYQADLLSPTWPWRDWVVRAFNRNAGFDQFVIDQLAGDLRPGATQEQQLATAFNRLHRMTNEGGSIREEFREEYAADRVKTFGTAFLGLTLGCARCHDHKFDPVTQREHYALTAYFNSIGEDGFYHDTSRVPTPALMLPTDAQEAAIRPLEAALRDRRDELRGASTRSFAGFLEWLRALPADGGVARGTADADLVAHYPLDEIGEKGSLVNLITRDDASGESVPAVPGSAASAHELVEGKIGRALRLDGDSAARFPKVLGKLGLDQPFTVALWIRPADDEQTAILLHRSGGTDVGYFGTELSLVNGRLRFAMVRHWPGNANVVETLSTVQAGRWTHVAVSYDGSHSARGMRIDIDGEADSRMHRDSLTKAPGHGGTGFEVGGRFRGRGFAGGLVDDIRAYGRALAPLEVAQLVDAEAVAHALRRGDVEAIEALWLAAVDPVAAAARARVLAAARALFAARRPVQEVMVMRETPQPRPTHVLARGAYDAERNDDNRVGRGTPAVLPSSQATDRLGLAQWLVDPQHPLLARVTVNRVWQQFFGRGIVSSADNFGLQGARPSHPDLLDWLAHDFITSGWDYKALCRSIVLSATYRQSSARRPELAERDPDNRLLGRGPSRRLSAESLRDLALAASGLLDRRRGGPSVQPYQPPGLWRESNAMTPAYRQSTGTALYRRSLYSVWKRTAPLPNMTAFDVTTREVCTVGRRDTNTPLQALVLLNDVQFVEAARVLAETALRDGGGSRDTQLRLMHLRLAGCEPDADAAAALLGLWERQAEDFAANVESAKALISVGEAAADPALDPVELAAATVVSQCVLNLDATVWKR